MGKYAILPPTMSRATIFIAGAPGVGKTTLGNALAQKLGGTHLDFDVVSSQVVSEGRAAFPGLTESQLLAEIKDLRYGSLMDALRLHLSTGDKHLVVSAPFTREMADPSRWESWTRLCHVYTLLWLFLDESERRRVACRAAARDVGFVWQTPPPPKVSHYALDSGPECFDVLEQALDRLRNLGLPHPDK